MAETLTSKPYRGNEKYNPKEWRFVPGINGGELVKQSEKKKLYDEGQAEKAKKPLTVLDKFDDAVSGGRKRSAERPFSDTGYYQKHPRSNPTPSTPKGPGPKKGPAVAAAPKAPVATAPRTVTAKRTTISNVNSSDRGGYTTSRPDTGWGAGNTNPYAKSGSSALAKKGVTVKKASGNSAGKAFKGLKWFNGKD